VAPIGRGATSGKRVSLYMSVWLLLVLVSRHIQPNQSNAGHCCISDTGAQPLLSEDGKLILAVNGEIYNYIALRKAYAEGQVFKTHSDCEVILHLVSQIAWVSVLLDLASALVPSKG
jgi:glutamine phosphoribosylpyrophosphate amidotransferase